MRRAEQIGGAVLLSLGVLYLGFFVDRTNFWSLFLAFCVSFSGYLLLVRKPHERAVRPLVYVGSALRVALVFAFPLLSDDVYRFLWDGYLVLAGSNPFEQLPSALVQSGTSVPGLSEALFERLNSPDYFTIYPPVAQGVFTLSAWLGGGSWYWSAVVMKLFLLGCELGTLWCLQRLLKPQNQGLVLLYWLNPLILVEITGNLHFEGAMIFFLLLSFWCLKSSKYGGAAGAMALAVAAKLLPLMLLPFLVKRLWWRPFLHFSVVFGVALLLLFARLLTAGFFDGFGSSLDLYFRKFEFNASLYYLFRAYGYYEVGWNQIARFGPLLARVAAVGILLFAALEKYREASWERLPTVWLFAFVLYLLCATTVHPWYLGVPIALCVLTQWRFPLVWSFLIMLTYTNYLTDPYEENLWLVATEYLLVLGFFVWEATALRRKPLLTQPE